MPTDKDVSELAHEIHDLLQTAGNEADGHPFYTHVTLPRRVFASGGEEMIVTQRDGTHLTVRVTRTV